MLPKDCRVWFSANAVGQRVQRQRVIGTLAIDGWAVTFGTARRGLGGAAARPGPSSLCTKCNSPPINEHCINFVLFDVAL